MQKNLNEWLNHLEQNCSPKSLGFNSFKDIVKKMGLSKFTCPIIIVGGTNGKGSTCHYLKNILQKSGYNTACYTSPHLLVFNERIEINGKNCSDIEIINAFTKIANNTNIKKLTYFEFITLAAFYIFQRYLPDIMILEVGLGGRYDPVNVLKADISIITNIDLEHTERLGNDREQIAFEKSGILRANQFFICADKNPPKIIKKIARQLPVKFIQISATAGEAPIKIAKKTATILQKNFNFTINKQHVEQGIYMGKPRARFQLLQTDPELIIDVAHNPAGAKFLAKQLSERTKARKTIAIVGILQTKDAKNILLPFINLIDEWYCIDLKTPKAIPSQNILTQLRFLGGKNVHDCITAKKALEFTLRDAQKRDRIVVLGSFYTAAEIINAYDEGKY